MRQSEARRKVSIAIEDYLSKADTKRLYHRDTLRALYALDKSQRAEWKAWGYEYYDINLDEEVSYDAPFHEMLYISDRFVAPHRLAYLIYGIENGKF